MHCGADQFMLARQSSGQNTLVKTLCDKIVIRGALAGQNGAAGVHKGKNEGCLQTFVFRLDVIDDATVFDICIVASNQCFVRVSSGELILEHPRGHLELNTTIFPWSIYSNSELGLVFCFAVFFRLEKNHPGNHTKPAGRLRGSWIVLPARGGNLSKWDATESGTSDRLSISLTLPDPCPTIRLYNDSQAGLLVNRGRITVRTSCGKK